MIQSYLLTLEPMEPYFFGNEKTFSFDPKSPADNRYFIKSERLPMQTTILGALRYLLMPMKKEEAVAFFNLINALHEKTSVIITTNKAPTEWVEVLQDEVLATALLDRLLYRCDVVKLSGSSYRMENRSGFLDNKKEDKR
jgi:hypothetical protein